MIRRNSTVTVKKDEKDPQPTEIIAQAIIDVSAAAKKLLSSRLSMRAIVILIQHSSVKSLSIADIQNVLNCAATLEETYIKKAPKK